jgi:hypothetical protein
VFLKYNVQKMSDIIYWRKNMKRLLKSMFVAVLVALLLSVAVTSVSLACNPSSGQIIYQDEDPNEPEPMPEMVVPGIRLDLISEDVNEPDPLPEMVAPGTMLNLISEDANEPEPPPEMVLPGI